MKCATDGCINERVAQRTFCHKCRQRKYRSNHPLRAWYQNLKTNAKRRGKPFTLTLEQFSDFCKQTGYDEKKGRTADSLSVDRINASEGYHAWNIQAITLSENSKKKYDDAVKPDDNCPF
jgi:hypothetical protein